MNTVRICSWDTPEASAQAHLVMQAIREYDPACVPEYLPVPRDSEGTSRVFSLSALDRALLEGCADLAVQSLSQLPLKLSPGLPIVAVGPRADACGMLVFPPQCDTVDQTLPLGVATEGQKAQLAERFPGWEAHVLDASPSERLLQLDRGAFGGMLFSACELAALGQEFRPHERFSLRQMLPPSGAGILAVQGRLGESMARLCRFHDVDSWDMTLCERAFSEMLGDRIPHAVYASVQGDSLTVSGMMADQNGTLWTGTLSGRREDAGDLGSALAARLRVDAAGPRVKKRYED